MREYSFHTSHVTCHASSATCIFFKVLELVGKGSVIKRAYPIFCETPFCTPCCVQTSNLRQTIYMTFEFTTIQTCNQPFAQAPLLQPLILTAPSFVHSLLYQPTCKTQSFQLQKYITPLLT